MVAHVVVVGAGYAGVMAANRVASAGLVYAVGSGDHRPRLERTLTALGVEVRAGLTVTEVRAGGVDVRGSGVDVDGGGVLGSDCTIWAGSFEAPGLARRSGLPVDRRGRLRTEESLVCVDHPRIVGVGDAAAPPGTVVGHVRMSCQASIPMGAHGADTVLALLDGRQPSRLSVGFVGQAVSPGRRHGLILITRPDDSARALRIRGRAAAAIKEVVCRSTVHLISRAPRLYRWPPGPRYDSAEISRVLEC